jgi:acyl-CoA thioesterase
MHVDSGAQERAEASVRAMYDADRASQALGMRILDVQPGAARVAMAVRPDMANGHGICHGGVLFALADSAFAFACNSHGTPTVAAAATIDFLRPVKVGDQLVAAAAERSRGRRTGVYDVTVQDQDNAIVALFRGRSSEVRG